MNAKLKQFCKEYIVDLNAVAAARRAGYKPSTATARASDFLRDPEVAAEIARLQAERAERVALTADEVVEEIRDVAMATLADVCEWDGEKLTVIPSAKLRTRGKRAIAEITFEENTTKDGYTTRKTKIKMHPKVSALELAGRHLGLFVDRTKIEGELAIDLSREEADAYKAKLAAMTPEELDRELERRARA